MSENLPPKESVYNAITESNLIGRGGNAGVYNLDGYPDIVVRASKNFSLEKNIPFSEPKIIDGSAFQGRNFGQAIAQYGDGVTILHRQKGIACGVPTYLGRGNDVQSFNDKIYEDLYALAARLPQESFKNLLRDMQFIHSINRKIDPSKSNNLLIDKENGRFNIVDLNPVDPQSNFKNSPADFVVMLFDNAYAWQYKGQNTLQLVQSRKAILDKIICAAEMLQIPFCNGKVSEDSSLSYSLTLAGYPENSVERADIEKRIESTGTPQRADGQTWVDGAPPKGSGFAKRFK